MNRIKKDPSLALLIVWLGGFVVIIALAVSNSGIWLVVIFIIYALSVVFTTGWVLHQKGKSQSWLWFFLFIGIVPIAIALWSEKTNAFTIWRGVEEERLISTKYTIGGLREALSCPTCIYFNQKDVGGWCNASAVPDIEKTYCATFRFNAGVLGGKQ